MQVIKRCVNSPIFLRLATVCLNFLTNVLINRSLGLVIKGQYTIVLNYANFLQLMLNFGVCYAYPLLRNQEGEKNAKITVLTIVWMQALSCVFFSVMVLLVNLNLKTLMIVLLSATMICNNQIVFIALIDDIRVRNLILLSSAIFYVIGNVFCSILAPGKLYIIVGLLILKYLYEIIVIVKVNKYAVFSISAFSIKTFLTIIKVGVPTAILAILISCNYNIDIFMLNLMNSGDTQIGIYGVAYSLTNMLWIIPDAFKELIYNRSAREDNYNYVVKSIFANMCLCILICLVFLLIGKWFLRFVYGEEYIVAYDVSLTLFCGVIPMVAFKLIHPIYVNKGKAGVVVFFLFLAVITNIISSWILIPHYGAFGAAIASVISYAVCGVLFFVKFYKDKGVRK